MNYCLAPEDRSAPTCVKGSRWQRTQLRKELGTCFTDYLQLEDGLSLAYTDYQARYDLRETVTLEREQSLVIAIALEGHSSIISADGRCIDFVPGHSTVSVYASARGERRVPANQSIRQLRVIANAASLSKYGLENLLPDGRGERSGLQYSHSRHGAATRRLAESLIRLHDDAASLLDTYVATLTLLSQQTRQLMPATQDTPKIRSHDQDKLLRARDILTSQFDRALSVAYLCTAVNLNEFKLKQGFRAMFGVSPHRMLTDVRMARAWELLETGLHVSTVAYKVGFQHLSSFSAAFERYYGKTPKSVRGK
jgi:AraC-like DNA-binding protein